LGYIHVEIVDFAAAYLLLTIRTEHPAPETELT